MFQVLLYYKFVTIEDPAVYAAEHLALTRRLGLKGRVIIAREGINGTLSGTKEATEEYMRLMHADERFADMPFKIDEAEGHVFKKLFVRAKEEIVTLRYERPIDPQAKTGTYLEPKDFLEAMESKDVVVLDGRSDYEYDLGHFEGAIRPNVKTFREFPQWIRENMLDLRDKPILTYCTGGIRCEKLTAVMLEEGFTNVAQLKGGIVTYGKDETARGKHFQGTCYVFDERIAVPVNQEATVVVSRCKHCGTQSDRYINCANLDCHTQHFACEACEAATHGFCSPDCASGRTAETKRGEIAARRSPRRSRA